MKIDISTTAKIDAALLLLNACTPFIGAHPGGTKESDQELSTAGAKALVGLARNHHAACNSTDFHEATYLLDIIIALADSMKGGHRNAAKRQDKEWK